MNANERATSLLACDEMCCHERRERLFCQDGRESGQKQ